MAAPRTPADLAREFARLPARFAGTFAAQIRWPRHSAMALRSWQDLCSPIAATYLADF